MIEQAGGHVYTVQYSREKLTALKYLVSRVRVKFVRRWASINVLDYIKTSVLYHMYPPHDD